MKLALMLVLGLVGLSPLTTAQEVRIDVQPQVIAAREADVHNYLVMRLRLLKRGAAIEDLKGEVVNQIDFSTLTPRSIELLRRLLTLSDREIANQAKLGAELTDLSQKSAEAASKQTNEIGGAAITSLSTGSALPFVLALLATPDTSGEFAAKREQLLAGSAAELGSDVSMMEFDLAILRSQLQSAASLAPTDFVCPGDYEQFLNASAAKEEDERVAGVAAALERSPKLQPASLYLAAHFYEKGDGPNCVRYSDKAIETAPGILRRDSLRAQARIYKADLKRLLGDHKGAIAEAELGLKDDPAQVTLLWIKAIGLAFSGDHAAALPLFEKLGLLAPRNANVHYNLACCQAVAGKDVEAALGSLRTACAVGFTDIAHAKRDVDLDLLRKERRVAFDKLTSVRLSPAMDWQLLDADDVIVTNDSAFGVVDYEVTITVQGVHASAPTTEWASERKSKIASLAPGASIRIAGVVDTTRDVFRSVRIQGTGAQGTCDELRTARELELSSQPVK